MFVDDAIEERNIDMAEIYRQNYLDALDEIRNLRIELEETRKERDMYACQLEDTENYIRRNNEGDFISFQILK